MFLNKSTEYAIRLVLHLIRQSHENYVRIRVIAEDCGISYFQLGKVAQALIKAGILYSYTGPNGGVKLAKDPSRITLFDVVDAVEGTDLFEKCVLGLDECDDENPCPVHSHWKNAREVISTMFKEKTVGEFVEFQSSG